MHSARARLPLLVLCILTLTGSLQLCKEASCLQFLSRTTRSFAADDDDMGQHAGPPKLSRNELTRRDAPMAAETELTPQRRPELGQ